MLWLQIGFFSMSKDMRDVALVVGDSVALTITSTKRSRLQVGEVTEIFPKKDGSGRAYVTVSYTAYTRKQSVNRCSSLLVKVAHA